MDSLSFTRAHHALPFYALQAGHPKTATLGTALQPFRGWPTRRAGDLQPSSILLDTPFIRLLGAKPPTSLSVTEGLATLGAYLVFSVIIN
jgi:hypothetical protein